MSDSRRDDLSMRGQVRRENMLGELVESMGTLHRRRQIRRRVGTGIGFGVVALTLVVFAGPSILRNGPSHVVDLQPSPPDTLGNLDTHVPPRSGRIEIVRTRPEIVAQYTPQVRLPLHVQRVSPRRAVTVEIIGDQMLLQMLAQMDRPTGLVRADGKVWLTAPVTDAELEKLRDTGGTGSAS